MTTSLVGPQPLHDRVREAIESQIRSGDIPPGARLQSERDLADHLGVSRVTVRRALAELAREGLVRAAPGSGRYVQGSALAEPPNALLSFTELGARRGLSATSRVLRSRTRPATLEEADAAGIAPGAAIFELDRLRMLDGVAVALDQTRVPLAVAPLLPEYDFRVASLYDALDDAGAAVTRAEYTTEACAASATQARQLDLAPGDPLLLAKTTSFDETGRLVELGETYYRGDRYRFHATLVRERRPGGGKTA
jgi:GntR family transcriptional regulator